MPESEQERFPPAVEAVRRYPTGAELVGPDRVSIRVWAPSTPALAVWIDDATHPLQREASGYFSAIIPARAGSRYAFKFPDDDRLYPDPASKHQPEGPEKPSAIVDLSLHRWRDQAWPGLELSDQVFVEIHTGTWTTAGTWAAGEAQLGALRDAGITAIQLMPIGEYAGTFGWGYDAVQWFAPTRNYGAPADFQHFVDAAHQHGLGVILDVVYNHLGPAGNFLRRFSPQYFSDRYTNEWGEPLNFDGEGSAPMRELVLSNVEYWLREFHLDGFRIDAAHQIYDASPEHILAALSRVARTVSPKPIVILAEHEGQQAHLMRPSAAGGFGLDGIYNEDFHHSVRVALTGVRESYFSDYAGSSAEWLAAAQWGFLFQGQYYPWQTAPRGAPALDRPLSQFVCFLENHDQIANSPTAQRLIDLTNPAWWRAMSALLLLGPWTPLLFQGQEYGASQPFRYFCDHAQELQHAVLEGRRAFLSQFGRMADGEASLSLDGLGRPSFESSRQTQATDARTAHVSRLYRDLLALRREDPSLGQHAARVLGATLGERTLLLRYLGQSPRTDRLLIVNLAADMNIASAAQPLVAPPSDSQWTLMWCSEDRAYGGSAAVPSDPPARMMATGHAATVFEPRQIAL
jgi:maltooligosyltrehalose trehalohydrolase